MDQKRRNVLKSAAMAGLGITTVSTAQPAAPLADWLVLVYMNGKNDLAPFAIQDFEEMAKVGSNKRLHVVVELGRPADPNYNGDRYGGWSGVKRFYIKPKMTPDEKNAVLHVAAAAAPAGDMGSPQVLDDFISWGAKNYPAKKKMLVIWNHGKGWRLILSAAAGASATAGTARVERLDDASGFNNGTYRSVSSDSDHRSILYNKQVQTVLEAQAANGTRFDVVA
jgi:hypothetical protein